MLKILKRIFSPRTEQDKLHDYLSQATDRVHLEYLQREWDRMTYAQRSNWR